MERSAESICDAIAVAWEPGIADLWADPNRAAQGSVGDWAQESAKMGDMYSNALVVLAKLKRGALVRSLWPAPSMWMGPKSAVHARLGLPGALPLGQETNLRKRRNWLGMPFRRVMRVQRRLGESTVVYPDVLFELEDDPRGATARKLTNTNDRLGHTSTRHTEY